MTKTHSLVPVNDSEINCDNGNRIYPEGRTKVSVNVGQDDEMEICGYSTSFLQTAFTWFGIILTAGLLRLFFFWKPHLYLKATHTKCSMKQANKVLLKDQYQQYFVHSIYMQNITRVHLRKAVKNINFHDKEECIKYFVNKKIKYTWNESNFTFEKLRGLDDGTCSIFHSSKGLNDAEHKQQLSLYGCNAIVVHVESILKLLFTQALNPFYIFQLFSILVWYSDEYEIYASCILIVSIFTLTLCIYQTRKMQRALKNTIPAHTQVTVCRNLEFGQRLSDDLVPGDLIEIPRHGCVMQCDAVLLTGNCIVNESMLTGESIPVTKTPIPNPISSGVSDLPYDSHLYAKHTLFSGTDIIQTRYYGDQRVTALVINTGYDTMKGSLVRSILFPRPVDFKFSQDALKFVGVLALLSLIGMIYTLVLMISRGSDASDVAFRCLDLITITIPPALPAAMTVGIIFAQNRLRKALIYCISPRAINLTGAIDLFCFDKTGTLTEEGLDLWGIVPAGPRIFQSPVQEIHSLEANLDIIVCMATCHSLTIINGTITGDPLDIKMHAASKWSLDEPGQDTNKFEMFMPTVVRPAGAIDDLQDVGIVRQFTFSSSLQRMSVVTRGISSDHFHLYSKGSPEMISQLCCPESVPENFHEVLSIYAQVGYRVIGLAHKKLVGMTYVKVQRAIRETLETQLIFLGLLVMENRLKPQTTPVIRQLQEANIRTVMVTGDNILTAISVARECGIVPKRARVFTVDVSEAEERTKLEWTCQEKCAPPSTERRDFALELENGPGAKPVLAIAGSAWAKLLQHFPDEVNRMLLCGAVYARMSPSQKVQLVEQLQRLDYYVGMCGDGANDCGALKTAHTGISLSEAEASVASPFTSKSNNITCVPTTLREGRCALVTSLGVFKYMAGYSMTQFITVCTLYWIDGNLTDFIFLYIDMIIITTLCITFCYTSSCSELASKPPTTRLISFFPITSIIAQIVLNAITQVIAWFLIRQQPWFKAYVKNENDEYSSFEMTGLFCVSAFQYISMAIVFSKSTPYRRRFYTNVPFIINLNILIGLTVYITLSPAAWIVSLMEMKMPPDIKFRFTLVGIALINFIICFMIEEFALEGRWLQKIVTKKIKEKSKRKHLKLMNDTRHKEKLYLATKMLSGAGDVDNMDIKFSQHDSNEHVQQLTTAL